MRGDSGGDGRLRAEVSQAAAMYLSPGHGDDDDDRTQPDSDEEGNEPLTLSMFSTPILPCSIS
jgi:hypothetical protein